MKSSLIPLTTTALATFSGKETAQVPEIVEKTWMQGTYLMN